MEFVADLHLHSKYSRAVSPSMTLPVMAQYAMQKGIDILTASDWTHPVWFKEIQGQLEEAGQGIYALKSEYRNPKSETNSPPKADQPLAGNDKNSNVQKEILFVLSTEISSIYKQGDKLRRIHNLVFVPGIETASKFNKELLSRGCNLSADGRPIIGLSSKNLLELLLSIDERAFLIPCHIWTPHFGIYGSASGFDSLEEAFGDMAKYIYGIETGLSSDPDMNWQVKELMQRSILSFSDAHSPAKMGREATVFELAKASFENIRKAIMRTSLNPPNPPLVKGGKGGFPRNDRNKVAYTLEFYPEEGKYHFSGHRNCKYAAGPEELARTGNICRICKRRLTEGVFFRVQQLSDETLLKRAEIKKNQLGLQWFTDKLHIQPPYIKLVPLLEVVAEAQGSTVASQKTQAIYADLCTKLGGELEVLLRRKIAEIAKVAGERVAEGVEKVRSGDIVIKPGYDGEYGVVEIFGSAKQNSERKGAVKKISRGQLGLNL